MAWRSSATATGCATGGPTACTAAGTAKRSAFSAASFADGGKYRDGPGGVRSLAAHTSDWAIGLTHAPQGLKLCVAIGTVILIKRHSCSPSQNLFQEYFTPFSEFGQEQRIPSAGSGQVAGLTDQVPWAEKKSANPVHPCSRKEDNIARTHRLGFERSRG